MFMALDSRRCLRLGNVAYEALVQGCPQIQELRLYATQPSEAAIHGCCALSQLRVIDLTGAHAATGQQILTVCHGSPSSLPSLP
jgi:hypothetical protein